MVGSDMAIRTGLGLSRFFKGKPVSCMTRRATAETSVRIDSADALIGPGIGRRLTVFADPDDCSVTRLATPDGYGIPHGSKKRVLSGNLEAGHARYELSRDRMPAFLKLLGLLRMAGRAVLRRYHHMD